MIRTTLILLLSAFCFHTYGQTTGFYLTRSCAPTEQRQVVMITDQKVCIADQPIITHDEIESLGELKKRNNKFYFDIALTDLVIKKVNVLSASLTEPSVALVIEGNIFAILPLDKLEKKKVYRLSGNMHYYPTVLEAYGKLEAVVKDKK